MGGRTASIAVTVAMTIALSLVPIQSRATSQRIIAREYRVQGLSAVDGSLLMLYAYEKYPAGTNPNAQAAQGRIVLILHGATTSGRVNYDVQVPGTPLEQSYSLMDQFARRGYDVWTMDYQNYGRSDKHECGLCVTTEAVARDVESVMRFITVLRRARRLHLIGWSWGAQVAGVVAEANPALVDRLVLYAPPAEPGPSPQITEHFRTNSAAGLPRLFHPTARVPEAVEAWVRAALAVDARSPNGVLVDLGGNPVKFTPTQITAPTLVIYGAEDPIAPPSGGGAGSLFRGLATTDKKLVIVPGAGHGLYMERSRDRWYQEVLLHLEQSFPRLRVRVEPSHAVAQPTVRAEGSPASVLVP